MSVKHLECATCQLSGLCVNRPGALRVCSHSNKSAHHTTIARNATRVAPTHPPRVSRAVIALAGLLLAGRIRLWHSWVLGAQMRSKLAIALPLVVLLHFSDRSAGGQTRRVILPCTCRTGPRPNALFFNPYRLPMHCGSLTAIWSPRRGGLLCC